MTRADDVRRPLKAIGVVIFGLAAMAALFGASKAAAVAPPWASLEPGKATLHATVNPHGVDTRYQFEWSTDGSYYQGVPEPAEDIGSGEEDVAVAQTIEVAGNTTYYFRLSVITEAGVTSTADESFTTPDWRPNATTEPASSPEQGKAVLHAKVNPNGLNTSYRFEWGTSQSYGQTVPVPAEDIGSGEEDIAVAQTIDLSAGVTYHYRIVASSREGTTYGRDEAFTAPESLSVAPDPLAFRILAVKAHSSGRLDVFLSTPGPGSLRAKATAMPPAPRKGVHMSYGHGSTTVGSAGSTRLTIRSRAYVCRLLNRSAPLRVRLDITYRPLSGASLTLRKVILVYRPPWRHPR